MAIRLIYLYTFAARFVDSVDLLMPSDRVRQISELLFKQKGKKHRNQSPGITGGEGQKRADKL